MPSYPFKHIKLYICLPLFFLYFSIFFTTMETTLKYWMSAADTVYHSDLQMQMCSEDSIGSSGILCSACTMRNESISAMNMSPSVPEKTRSNSTFASFENTTIWFLGTINCILVALVFSKGKPFRQPTYTNCEYH